VKGRLANLILYRSIQCFIITADDDDKTPLKSLVTIATTANGYI